MASRRFFGYDPYDYYYAAAPYQYPYPYYHHHHQKQPAPARGAGGFIPAAGDADQYYYNQPAPTRSAGGFFPAAGDADKCYYDQLDPTRSASRFFPAARDPEPAVARAAARPNAGSSRSVSIPVRFVGSDTEPEVARMLVKRPPSEEEAAVRLQAAGRGFLARRAVRAVRAVEREAEEVASKVAREAEALRGDARARIGVGEQLMRLLLRLDAVHGAREYRRRVARRVLALQDAVDAQEQRPVVEAAAAETGAVVTMAKDNAVAPELPGAGENSGVTDDKTAAEMEVDGGSRAADDQGAATEADTAPGAAMADDAEGEWEMVTEEPAAAVASSLDEAARPQELAAGEETRKPAKAGVADGGVDAKKVMEMVAALCERSAEQCALIGALAERVDALERAVRSVEVAERRRRRAKKLKKEGKQSNHIKCYSD